MMEFTESISGALGLGVVTVLLEVKLSMINFELHCCCSKLLIVDVCCANFWFKSTIIRMISGCIFWVGLAEKLSKFGFDSSWVSGWFKGMFCSFLITSKRRCIFMCSALAFQFKRGLAKPQQNFETLLFIVGFFHKKQKMGKHRSKITKIPKLLKIVNFLPRKNS